MCAGAVSLRRAPPLVRELLPRTVSLQVEKICERRKNVWVRVGEAQDRGTASSHGLPAKMYKYNLPYHRTDLSREIVWGLTTNIA